MKSSNPEAAAPPLNRHHPALLWLKRRRLMVGGIAVAAVALAFGWDWLAATGLLFILPCAIMMGMCMKGMFSGKSGKSCSHNEQTTEAADPKPALAPLPAPSSKHTED